jgi:hypothetical protein
MNRSYDDNVRNSTDRNHTESGRTYVSTEYVRKSPDRVMGREGGSGRGSAGVGGGEGNGDVKSSRDGNYLNSVTSSQDGSSSGVGVRSESGRGDRNKNNTAPIITSAVGLGESSSKLNTQDTPHSTTQRGGEGGGPSTLDTYRKNIAGNTNANTNSTNNNIINNNSSNRSGLSGRNNSISPPFTHDKPLVKSSPSFSTSKSAVPYDTAPSQFKDSKNSETDTGTCLSSTILNFVENFLFSLCFYQTKKISSSYRQ